MTVRELNAPTMSRLTPFSIGAMLSGILVLAVSLVLLLKPMSPGALHWVSDGAKVGGPLVILLIWLTQLYRVMRVSGWRRGKVFWAQMFIGLGLASEILAQIGWSINDRLLHIAPFPAWTDFAYLAYYPLVFIGIYLLPARRFSALSRLQLSIDGLALTTAATTLSWYFLIGPVVNDTGSSGLSIFVSTLYPICDLILLACLGVLWIRSNEPRLRRVLGLLTATFMIVVVADTIFQIKGLGSGFQSGTLIDVMWIASDMLLGLSVLAIASDLWRDGGKSLEGADPNRMDLSGRMPYWFEYLPYLALPLMLGFFMHLSNTPGDGDNYLEPGVLLGCVIFTGLIITRQLLAIRENQRLHGAIREDARRLTVSNQNLETANARLESLSTTDPLTNLLNHRALNLTIDQEIERAHRYQRPFSLLFIDLDHFKMINDTYGHGSGDNVLKEFATVAQSRLRGVDSLGRWGGEEFLVLLPEIDGFGVMECAERVRESVAGHLFEIGDGVHVTSSIGVASYPEDAVDRDALIELADKAMYAAKRLGRNQVRRSSDAAVIALELSSTGTNGRDRSLLIGVVEALAAMVDARDHYTGRHTAEVGHRATRLALKLGLDAYEAEMLGMAGLLHDIGKVGVPDAILQKPARLTAGEWVTLRKHTTVGADVVARIPGLSPIAPIIRAHHEHWDGSGYPDGLAGESIPLGARIISVVDAYGAITSDRPYRAGRSREWARAEMIRGAGQHFDPVVVEAFLAMLETEDPLEINSNQLVAT